MAKYTYKAMAKDGSIIVRQNVEAVDESELILDQKSKGNDVFYIKQNAEKKGVKEFSPRELADFSHELSIMLSSGLTVIRALAVMSSQTGAKNRRLIAVYADLSDLLKKGHSFSEACRKQGGAFPELLINAVYSGEASGNMALVARQMSEYYERIVRINQKIKGATTYPKLLMGMTAVIVVAMFTFILPQFFSSGMFDDVKLPALTVFMFSVSEFITKNYLYVGGAAIAAFVVFKVFLQTSFFRAAYDKYTLRLPVIGKLVQSLCTSRFASTLSYLHNSGIMLVQAVPIAVNATNNKYIAKQMSVGIKKMLQGEMLSTVLNSVNIFNARLSYVVLIGEETGNLSEVLTNTAAVFEEEMDAAISRLLTMLTPALLFIMAIVVGGVAISVMLPIFSLYQNM